MHTLIIFFPLFCILFCYYIYTVSQTKEHCISHHFHQQPKLWKRGQEKKRVGYWYCLRRMLPTNSLYFLFFLGLSSFLKLRDSTSIFCCIFLYSDRYIALHATYTSSKGHLCRKEETSHVKSENKEFSVLKGEDITFLHVEFTKSIWSTKPILKRAAFFIFWVSRRQHLSTSRTGLFSTKRLNNSFQEFNVLITLCNFVLLCPQLFHV